ncbi:MAG: HypC/HybG/HupF family hydrogenase formation chaperone [Carbonactinosporaceae bacterium]
MTEGTRASAARDSATVPAVTECAADVCVTCSDTAVTARVLRLLGGELALVDTGASEEEVSVALVDADVGDTILVHAKEAIAVIPGGPDG